MFLVGVRDFHVPSPPSVGGARAFKECCVHHKEVYGLLLNLDVESPNAHTVSLFRNGVRACKPQSLPESMKGKVLFPTVNFRNMTLLTNYGLRKLRAPIYSGSMYRALYIEALDRLYM